MQTVKQLLDSLQELVIIAGMAVTVYLTWRNGTKIQDVHSQINSRMSELLELTRVSSKALGVKEGQASRDFSKQGGK